MKKKTQKGSKSSPDVEVGTVGDLNEDWRTCAVGEFTWDCVFRHNDLFRFDIASFDPEPLESSIIIIPTSWQLDTRVFEKAILTLEGGTRIYAWKRIK